MVHLRYVYDIYFCGRISYIKIYYKKKNVYPKKKKKTNMEKLKAFSTPRKVKFDVFFIYSG